MVGRVPIARFHLDCCGGFSYKHRFLILRDQRGALCPGFHRDALGLTLFAVGSAGTAGLSAQDPLGDPTPGPRPVIQTDGESVWIDSTPDPLFLRLPPPDGLASANDMQSAESPRAGPLGTSPLGESRRSPFTAGIWWIPEQDVQNGPGELAVYGEELELGFPLRIEPNGIWLALGGVQRLEINTAAVLPDSGLPVPNQLWDIEMGVMHIRELSDGGQVGGMLRMVLPATSRSGLRDMTVTLLGFGRSRAGNGMRGVSVCSIPPPVRSFFPFRASPTSGGRANSSTSTWASLSRSSTDRQTRFRCRPATCR